MGFFRSDDGDSDSAEPTERIGEHGIPMAADSRLSGLGEVQLFTSTLSVNEFALLTELGPQPVAQVLGTSVYQVGWQYLPTEARWGGTDFFCQLNTVSQAWDEARQCAFDRLREEARLAGADAVVGVRLRRGEHDWARRAVDFTVTGTAVRLLDKEPAGRAEPALMLSDLSVQDYWKLMGAGWGPAGLVAATSVVFVSQGSSTTWRRRRTLMQNQELWEFSDGFVAARRAVVTDLRGQARSAGAEGVVGVSFDYEISRGRFSVSPARQQPTGVSTITAAMGGGDVQSGGADKRSGVVFTVHAVGTAIRRDRDRPAQAKQLALGTTLSLTG